jgi:hypothetical protein
MSTYAFEGVPHLTDVIVYAKPRNEGHLEKVQLSCTLQFEDIHSASFGERYAVD